MHIPCLLSIALGLALSSCVYVNAVPDDSVSIAELRPEAGGVLPYHPTASYINGSPTSLNYMFDGRVALRSNDTSAARHMDFWSSTLAHRGTKEWVQYNFDKKMKISSAAVYWWDDRPTGGCRVPTSWHLLYWDNDKWKEVKNKNAYGTERDAFNAVRFDTIKTTKLRLEVQEQERYGVGIIEWKLN